MLLVALSLVSSRLVLFRLGRGLPPLCVSWLPGSISLLTRLQLQSSAVAYKFGISGPWWYGAGATVQILLFAMLAAKLKLNAPYAHTWLEIVGRRWGRVAHLVFMFFG